MDINSSVLVVGTMNLLNDIITALTGVSILITIIMAIYYLIKKATSEGPEGSMMTKKLIVAIACSVLITIIKVIIQVITNYYAV